MFLSPVEEGSPVGNGGLGHDTDFLHLQSESLFGGLSPKSLSWIHEVPILTVARHLVEAFRIECIYVYEASL